MTINKEDIKRIAVFIDDYLPDSTKVAAKMMHELSSEFVHRGYQVDVFTPEASMAQSFVLSQLDGVNVYRFKSGEIKNTSLIKRGINEVLLSFRAWFYLRNTFKNNKYDLIVNYSPTIFWSCIVFFLKKKNNAFSYLILRDFFPQWIIDNKIIAKNSFVAHFFRFFEKLNYKSSDVIGIQSPNNISFFKSQCGDKYKISLLYNWAKLENEKYFGESYREKLNLEDKIIFLYGGNIGKAQDMSNLIRLALRVKQKENVHFLFVGQGDEVNLIKENIIEHNLSNITYLPPISQNEFKKLLTEVDIGLFTLCKSHQSHNFPGKLLGYMVNEIPILGSINPGNDLREIIDEFNAGFISVNGDDDILYENAIKLIDDPLLRNEMGKNAKLLLIDKFTVESAVNNILKNADI